MHSHNFYDIYLKKGAVPERPGTRWSTALVWHLQGPSACSKHLDTPKQQ